MKSKLLPLVFCTALLFGGINVTSISAADDVDKEELLEDYGGMKDEANELFDSLKDKYTDLANNYGNIEMPDVDKIHQDYLNQVQQGKEDLKIEEKLEEIRNTDLSVDNSEMKAEYEQAKKDAANKLSEAKLGSDAITNKFNTIKMEQTVKQKELEKERIKAAETKYNNIVSGYYEALNKKPNALPGIPAGTGQFSGADLKYLSETMGINFDKAVTIGKSGLLWNATMSVVNEISSIFTLDLFK